MQFPKRPPTPPPSIALCKSNLSTNLFNLFDIIKTIRMKSINYDLPRVVMTGATASFIATEKEDHYLKKSCNYINILAKLAFPICRFAILTCKICNTICYCTIFALK